MICGEICCVFWTFGEADKGGSILCEWMWFNVGMRRGWIRRAYRESDRPARPRMRSKRPAKVAPLIGWIRYFLLRNGGMF